MFKENRIIFGHGTIAVFSNWFPKALVIQYIQPPKEIGETITDKYEVIDEIQFKLQNDMTQFYNDLLKISNENPVIEFRGYVFDFTTFNPKSVTVLRNCLSDVINSARIYLAC